MKQPGRRFQQGYWHIEPMVLALNGSVLVMLCVYALINSVAGLLRGGHALAFDDALLYAASSELGSSLMYLCLRRWNRRLRSALVELDLHSWLMSSAISLALLLAFGIEQLLLRLDMALVQLSEAQQLAAAEAARAATLARQLVNPSRTKRVSAKTTKSAQGLAGQS